MVEGEGSRESTVDQCAEAWEERRKGGTNELEGKVKTREGCDW